MTTTNIVFYILLMAVVTYLIRMLPITFFTQKIQSPFIQSFLYYVPYAVLGAMTFPAIFFSTDSLWSAAAGTLIAGILAFKNKGLLMVAISACIAVYFTELCFRLFNI